MESSAGIVAQTIRRRIDPRGVVQGVGFRPFIYRIAHACGIGGRVLNSSDGVVIEAEGSEENVGRFLSLLKSDLPPLARIDQLVVSEQPARGELEFAIEHSVATPGHFALVPPDVAFCAHCATEFTDPANRRFGYPFTNCTNCGPRYTIIRDVPYDRSTTTMSEFPMCPDCQAEYEDPLSRRFHAEPNACPKCGPSLALLPETEFVKGPDIADVLGRVRSLLREGQILAVKGLGGFHLVCDATDEPAVALLRERKRRSGKAFAVMARDLAVAERLCIFTDADRALMKGSRKPIVLAPSRADAAIAASVAPGNARLGIMLPYTPLHRLLFDDSLEALVMTSGNISEEPIVCRNEDAWPRLHALADRFLLHNRAIQTRADDSVIQIFEGREYPVRRSRGYAPEPITLSTPLAEVLACGGELKNTLCLTKGRYAILSQHIGDLENVETLDFFRETLGHLQRFFRVSPRVVAHDLHPNYLSTRFALEESGLRPIAVQHHHAHIAGCMADNEIEGPVIGVALDGTGYGTDGKIWGGEFLVCDFLDFERCGHLRYIPLAGGDSGVRQPWRSALAYLRDASLPLDSLSHIPAAHLRLVDAMIARGINTIDTSSCGRLFDAVSSILGIRHESTYEGQAAIELEMAAAGAISTRVYPFSIESGKPFRVDVRPAIQAMIRDISNHIPTAEISARFHLTAASLVADSCDIIRASHHLTRVCLSGGTFQDLRLLKDAMTLLSQRGFEVFVHHRVPTNDGGLALGQAVIASHRITTGKA